MSGVEIDRSLAQLFSWSARGLVRSEMTEYSGLWTCRIFNPAYVTGDQTPQKELDLILADAVFDFQTPTSTTLQGIIGWPGGGLDLNGTVQPGVGGEPASFDIVGTGRQGSDTYGWEYRYHGHLARNWSEPLDRVVLTPIEAAAVELGAVGVDPSGSAIRPFLVGSVMRVKAHASSDGGTSPAGAVYSFIAVKQQPPFTWELSGSWTYRSFHNNPAYVFQTAPRTGHHLILAEAVFRLETPTSTTLQGEIEWQFAACDLKGTVRPGVGGEPASFDIVGTGRTGTNSAGKEYLYQGHRARSWTNAVDQRPALVGSFFSRAKPNRAIEEPIPLPEELMGTGYPFIAVKQQI
jgi:hypothetical protein